MAYNTPPGSAANFSTGGVDFPRGYDTLAFRWGSGTYTPPTGSAANFQFPLTPATYTPPPGDAANYHVEFVYVVSGSGEVTVGVTAEGSGVSTHPAVSGSGAVTVGVTAEGAGGVTAGVVGNGMASIPIHVAGVGGVGQNVSAGLVRCTTRAQWTKSRGRLVGVSSSYVTAKPLSRGTKGGWLPPSPAGTRIGSRWNTPGRADENAAAFWGAFNELTTATAYSAWYASRPTDDARTVKWGQYGNMVNVAELANWYGSKPADRKSVLPWANHLLPVRGPVAFPRPNGSAVSFSVIGGGIDARQHAGGYVPPYGNSIGFQFGPFTYRAPFYTPSALGFKILPGTAANFRYTPEYAILSDPYGNPVMGKSSRDQKRVTPWGIGRKSDTVQAIPWSRYSRPLDAGWGVVTPSQPQPPAPGETVTIPVKRVYIVVNEMLLARVSDSTPIPASLLSIAFDCDSWLPTFSATIPESHRGAVMPDPTPVEVMAYINGSEFRFFVERVVRNRQFGQRTVSISGRALACELDDPYAEASLHTNGTAMTAQQIIDAALAYSTYTQTWGITDWLVPANAFSLHGTPAQVAGAVAEASGSVLAADWSTRDLRMIPRYPVKPWDWATATPEYVIPSAITQTESIEWMEKPAYNVVYVSGVQTGVLGQVKITGTAGDKPAPMVTHQLITHNDAARQRGISILSDTGRKALMQISLPVLETTGVIDVCRLIEFSDGANTRRGIVRANNVSVNWPTVRQTLTIEAAV